MNNEIEFVVSAHNFLKKVNAGDTTRQANNNRAASILASPQVARKKRFAKLDLTQTSPPKGISEAPLQAGKEGGGRTKNPPLVKKVASQDCSASWLLVTGSLMTKKTLTLALLNVRGLKKCANKPREIKLWLAPLPSLPQIILIREHHLGKDGIQVVAKGRDFWQGASFWIEGIPMGRSKRMSAGTTILVDKSIAPLVTAHRTLTEGRAQYVTIQSPDNGTLTILNVYASLTSNERAQIWSNVATLLWPSVRVKPNTWKK